MAVIYGGDGYISSRDVAARIRELSADDECPRCGDSLSDGEICSSTLTLVTASTGTDSYNPATATITMAPLTLKETGDVHEPELDEDESDELDDLRALENDALSTFGDNLLQSDWDSGVTLTCSSELGETWAKERADDLGMIDMRSTIANYVNWGDVADLFTGGEPCVTYKGYDYYYL